MEQVCKNCKHWHDQRRSHNYTGGICRRITRGSIDSARAFIEASDKLGVLYTLPEFGCNQFVPAEQGKGRGPMKYNEVIELIEQDIFRLTIQMNEAYGENPRPYEVDIQARWDAIELLKQANTDAHLSKRENANP